MTSVARALSDRAISGRHLGLILLATVAASLPFVACGSEGSGRPATDARQNSGVVDISGTEPVGEVKAGSVAPLAECRDWNEATPAQRIATIGDVRSQINIETSSIQGPVLTDAEAADAFDRFCDAGYAQGFRLYKVYARVVGFIELQRALEK